MLMNDAYSGDCGYPSNVLRKDGHVLTLYYATLLKGEPKWSTHCGALTYLVPPPPRGTRKPTPAGFCESATGEFPLRANGRHCRHRADRINAPRRREKIDVEARKGSGKSLWKGTRNNLCRKQPTPAGYMSPNGKPRLHPENRLAQPS